MIDNDDFEDFLLVNEPEVLLGKSEEEDKEYKEREEPNDLEIAIISLVIFICLYGLGWFFYQLG
jgi:hypothetical protein